MSKMKITILGQVISTKNSHSESFDKYVERAVRQLRGLKYEGKYPIIMRTYLYRENMKSFDYADMVSTIQYVLVSAGVIDNDNMNHLTPVILGWEEDNGNNPRVEIEIEADTRFEKPCWF